MIKSKLYFVSLYSLPGKYIKYRFFTIICSLKKGMLFFICLIGLSGLFNLNRVYSADSTDKIVDKIDYIRTLIIQENYSLFLGEIRSLMDHVKGLQNKQLEKYFPSSYMGFRSGQSEEQYGDLIGGDDMVGAESTGVLFSKHYRNSQDYTIDINIVFSDPSIEEYLSIIQNPEMITNMKNTQLTKINNAYFALEKNSLEESYFERNILLNQDILVNIIANGVTEKSIVDNFLKKVNLSGLRNYLNK